MMRYEQLSQEGLVHFLLRRPASQKGRARDHMSSRPRRRPINLKSSHLLPSLGTLMLEITCSVTLCSILLCIILGKVSIEAREQQNLGVPTFQQGAITCEITRCKLMEKGLFIISADPVGKAGPSQVQSGAH
jgi:hypothetical protein